MNIKYFGNVNNVKELKKEYRKLAKKYHPDLNDNDTTKDMQAINNEYEFLFKNLQTDQDKKDGHKVDDSFRDIVNTVTKYDVNVDIVGSWIWLWGDYNATYNMRTVLKDLGFKWSKSNKKWYYAPYKLKKRKKSTTYQYKVDKYGKQSIKQTENKKANKKTSKKTPLKPIK